MEFSFQSCHVLINPLNWTLVSGPSALKVSGLNAVVIRYARKSNLPMQLCHLVTGRSRC